MCHVDSSSTSTSTAALSTSTNCITPNLAEVSSRPKQLGSGGGFSGSDIPTAKLQAHASYSMRHFNFEYEDESLQKFDDDHGDVILLLALARKALGSSDHAGRNVLG